MYSQSWMFFLQPRLPFCAIFPIPSPLSNREEEKGEHFKNEVILKHKILRGVDKIDAEWEVS